MAIDVIEPVNAGRKDKQGNDLYNLNLKNKFDKIKGTVEKGIAMGDSIIVEKVFEGGFKTTYDWAIKVIYKGKTCSFYLPDKYYESYKDCGGVGDKVKITANSYDYKFTDKDGKTIEGTSVKFDFELVQ